MSRGVDQTIYDDKKYKVWDYEKREWVEDWTKENFIDLLKSDRYRVLNYIGVNDNYGEELYNNDIIIMDVSDCDNCEWDYEMGIIWYMAPFWKVRSFKADGSRDLACWGVGQDLTGIEKVCNGFEINDYVPDKNKEE